MGRFGCAAPSLAGLLVSLGAMGGSPALADSAASALVQADDRPLEMSVILGGHFFSSTSALGRSDYAAPNSDIKNSVAIGGRLGYALTRYFMLEAEFLAMPTKLAALDSSSVLAYTGRGHLLFRYPFGPNGMIQPFVLLGGGALAVRPDPGLPLATETLGTFHAGAGLRVNIQKYIGLRLDGRMVLVPEVRTPSFTQDWEFLASAYIRFGFTPDKPPEPPRPVDSDNDGLVDGEDKCPTTAGLKENQGCPDVDTDGDSIVDRLDKCPDKAGLVENGGCPDVDSDGDGTVDRLDKCPAERGPRGNKGCPDTDTDGDGIVDRLDKCPNEPETKNGFQDTDGCPDELPQNLAKFVGTIQGLKFLPSKAILTKESLTILDEAAGTLQEHVQVRVEISGHTDSIGVPADNLLLSQQRAEAVKTYLVSKGVDANRLLSQGFGSTKPVADNATATGRAQNRRVEFRLLPPEPRRRAPVVPATPPVAPNPAAAPLAPTAPPPPIAPVAPVAVPAAPPIPPQEAAPLVAPPPAAPVVPPAPPPPPEMWAPPPPPPLPVDPNSPAPAPVNP